MGLFSKKPPAYSNNKQYEGYSITETISNMTKSFALMNVQNYVRQALESAKIVEKTTDPLTFFYRYDFLIKRNLDLIKMSKYVKFKDDLIEHTKKIINEKPNAISRMIYRSSCKLHEQLDKLSTAQSRLINIELFKESFVPYLDEMNEYNILYLNKVLIQLKNTCEAKVKEESKIALNIVEAHETIRTEQIDKRKIALDIVEAREEERAERIKEIQKKVQNSYPSNNGLKIPEIVMLYYARTYKTGNNNFQSFWYYEYGVEDVEKMLFSLEERGFICPVSARESIKNLKVNELKELLKELDLKLSGKKDELIMRINESASDEWLEEKIKNRAYDFTDLGVQELKENKYVSDFHRTKFIHGVDVWWINQQLHIRNYPKLLYRDLIYGELNRKLVETMKEMQEDDSGTYVPHAQYGHYKKEICEFLIEEDRYNDAFNSLAESVYYTISSNLIPYIHLGTKYVSERNLNINLFKCIKEKLGLSDNDMFHKMIDFYNKSNFPAPFALLSNQDVAGLIIALMNEEYGTVEKIFNELQKNSDSRGRERVEKIIRSRYNNGINSYLIDN